MQPVISVIIPALNEEHYLPHLLTDLKKQTEKNFEVIIVDAFSEDNTREKAIKFKDDLNLHFFESPKRHLSFQRNMGAEKAKGEYLLFLDADARILPDAIEKAMIHIEKEHDGLYLPRILSSSPKLGYRFLVGFVRISAKFLQKIGVPMSIGPLILIKKALFNEIGGFSLTTTASEDHNLVIKAYKQEGVKAWFLSDVKCVVSMRRLERDGTAALLWKYTVFTIETFIKGGVYKKSTGYVMGGQNYKKSSLPTE